jgi:hypothetical protein
LFFVAAVWLWQWRRWGFVLGGVLLVLAHVMLLALLTMSLCMALARFAGALDMFPVFSALTVVSLGLTVFFYAHVGRPDASTFVHTVRVPDTAAGHAPDTITASSRNGGRAPEPHAVIH